MNNLGIIDHVAPVDAIRARRAAVDAPGFAQMPSVALLMDAEHLRGVPSLVDQAVAAAIRKAAGR